MKSSHSHCKRLYCTADSFKVLQIALMHSRQLYCTAECFNAQQKALLHRRKLYCTADGFIVQHEVLPHSIKVSLAVETREKFLLRQKQRISPLYSVFSWTLDLMFAHKLAVAEWYFGAHLAERQANFLLRKSLD